MRTGPNPTRRRLLTGLAAVALGGAAQAQAPAPAAKPSPTPLPAGAEAEVLAYINGGTPVTRRDLGEFLIARGGAEKLELLVNKMIIEAECRKQNVTVTVLEMEAALKFDLDGLSLQKAMFVQHVLPRYGKTYYEWMEDVIEPRLQLTKLCRDRVSVAEADLRVQFEREYGERRKVQMILWPPGADHNKMSEQFDQIRKSQDEFDRAARGQGNVNLAAANGYIKPISRHLPGHEKVVEDRAFQMKPGEVSEIMSTSQGHMVMKLHEIIPPAAGVTFEAVKEKLEKQAFEEKMSAEIPKYFAELKERAAPNVLFKGPGEWKYEPPTDRAVRQGAEREIHGQPQPVTPAGGTAPAGGR